MPSQDVIQRTQQLRDELRKLAESSNTSGTSLGKLESTLNGLLTSMSGVMSIKNASVMIADFSKHVKGLTNDSNAIKKVTQSFLDLNIAMEKNYIIRQQMSYLGQTGVATKRLDAAITGGNMDEVARQQQIIQTQRELARDARTALSQTEQIWKDNLQRAESLQRLRNEVIKRLLGGGTPKQLGAGSIWNMPPGDMITGYQPPLPPVRPQLPSGRQQVPLLPAPQNVPLLPAFTGTAIHGPVGTIRMGETIDQYRNFPTESPAARFRRLTTVIDDAVTTRVESAAEVIETVPIDVNRTDADDIRTTPRGPRSRGGRNLDDLPPMWQNELPVSVENLRTLGLTDVAARNLNKSMTDLNMTSARVTNNVTELSTGIQTVSFQATDGTGAVRNFTTHLDRNGNVLQDTQKRFRSFGSAIMRDVVEVLKWTVAITAIYTPMRKLGELMEEMKKIQLDLVDVQIVLGNSTNQFATVLETSAQIATETSSGLEGVVEGYALAAAAAASAGDETQRTVVTQTLLKDSMVLSKLANIDQKQALDTLVGSLSQLGMSLTQGTQLLDSWVAVSKKANVSVKDMATSFTIVGSAAQEAGVSYDELNGLIGALAQSTNLSADELGNAVRGIISTMQTDKAQQAFAEYGIATKTVSGDFRDLMAILKQLKTMSESGIIDEKALGALTQAGGGGARRGAQLSALVEGLDKAITLSVISEQASGDAAEALSLEMGTLDAATTRLNNAFSELAVTLGTEGGILSFFTEATNLITSMIRGVRDLTGVLKTAAPVLATFMLAKGIMGTSTGLGLLNKNIPTSLAQMFLPATFGGSNIATGKPLTGGGRVGGFAPISNWLLGRTQATGRGGMPVDSVGPSLVRTATMGEFFGGMWNRINTPFATMLANRGGGMMTPGAGRLPLGLGQVSLSTLLGPLVMAASNIGQKGGGERALVGGVGALPGILMGSGVWATIGSIMATAFYDKFLTFEDDLATTWATKMAESREEREGEDSPEAELRRLNREARESMSAGEIFMVNMTNWAMNTWSKLPWSTQGGEQVTPEETGLGLALLNAGVLDEETKQKFIELYNKILRDQATSTETTNIVPSTQQTEIAQLAATASADIMSEALEQISKGAAGSVQTFLNTKSLAQKVGSTATGLIDAQLKMMQEVTLGVGPTATTFTPAPEGFQPMGPQEAVQFVAGLNSEESGALVSYYTEIADLYEKIKTLNEQIAGQTGGIASEEQIKELELYKTLLRTLPQEFLDILRAAEQGSKYRKIEGKMLPTVELPQMTAEQYQKVSEMARKFWEDYLRASGLTEDEIKAWVAAQNEALVTMEGQITPFKTNIPQQYFAPAMEGAGISGQMPGIVDWGQYTQAQFEQAKSIYPQFVKAIQQAFASKGLSWAPEESDALFFLKDAASVEHLDQMILQMLMRDLIDIEKDKGLQGLYNLPSGATFYVPVTAYELHRQTQAGMAGGGGGLSMDDIMALLADFAKVVVPPQEINPFQGTNLNEMAPGEGFTLGDKEYKMFGPPAPDEATVAVWSQSNPLPVVVTNAEWYTESKDDFTPSEILNPSIRVEREYGVGSYAPKAESSLPTWLSWAEGIGPAINKLSEAINKFFSAENFDIGIPNQTSYNPTENSPISTALSLSVDQKVLLTVDGRTLATIIKPYLYQDLIRFNTATTTSISRSVIA